MPLDVDRLMKAAANGDLSALTLLRQAADIDGADINALFALGKLFDDPSPCNSKLTPDSCKARSYYLKAAQMGHGLSQLCVGNMLDYGDGGDKDPIEARRWYAAAAEQGIRDAQMHYGRMLQMGRGGSQNLEEAAIWYQQAIEQEDELAATNLALMHLRGELRDSNGDLAIALFQYAANKLDGLAHLQLGEIYREGKFLEQNLGMALFHYCVAAILCPPNENREFALKCKEAMLDANPELRPEFEAAAIAYISEKHGTLPA